MPPVQPVELCVPADVDADRILDVLSRRFDVARGAPGTIDRLYVDTFDGRLHAAGLRVWRERRRGPDGSVRLTLEGNGAGSTELVTTTTTTGDARRTLAGDLPESSFRDTVRPLIEARALLPQVRVRGRSVRVALRNADGKTVARVEMQEPVADDGPGAKTLGRRVRLSPVLGYDKEFARAARLLRSQAGLTPSGTSLFEDGAAALGVAAGGCSSKVDVRLDPAMRSDDAMVLVCRRLVEIVEANLPGTLADLDIEFLHDLRVAVRRTRSVLKELKAVLPDGAETQARADLRWLQEVTGPTRDLDVQLEEWPATVTVASSSMAGDLGPLHELLTRHRAAAFASMRRQLKGQRFGEAWGRWRALVGDPDGWKAAAGPRAALPIGELAGRRIVSVYTAMVRMGRVIDDASPPEALHDLRKRGKELRYLLELFGGMWPARTVKPLVAALKDLQDVLGRFQDDEIQGAYLRRLGPEVATVPGGTDALIALGVVIEDLVEDQRRARAEFASRFDAFARPDNRRLVKRTFAGHDERGRKAT